MSISKIVPMIAMGLFLSVGSVSAHSDNTDTLGTETVATVEGWMFDTLYLDAEALSLESWMFDFEWLDNAIEVQVVEPWMMNESFLAHEASLEPWMFSTGYLKR